MIAKFISLLLLLIVIAGFIYVAITDVDIPQTEQIVIIDTAAPVATETTDAPTDTEAQTETAQ